MVGLGQAIDENIEGKNRIERIENLQDRFSQEEIQQMAENGSDVAEDALIQLTQNFLGNREAEEIITDEEAWEENPTEALEALREVLVRRDPDLDDYNIEDSPASIDHSNTLNDLLRNNNVEIAKEYSKMVSHYSDRVNSGANLKIDDIYEEKVQEVPETAIKIAEKFDIEKDKRKAVKALIRKYDKSGSKVAEAIARKQYGELRRRPAEELYEHFMEEEDYKRAAWVLQKAKEQGSMPTDYSEQDIQRAAEKEMEKRREEGNYLEAVEVAEEYNVQNDKKLRDTLLLGVTTGQIDEGYFEKRVDEHGYDLKIPGEKEEDSSEKDEEVYDQKVQEQPRKETAEESSGFLGKIREYVN